MPIKFSPILHAGVVVSVASQAIILGVVILAQAFLLLQSFSCSENKKGFDFDMSSISSNNNPDDSETNTSYLLPDIDLTNWKVTLPIGNPTSSVRH